MRLYGGRATRIAVDAGLLVGFIAEFATREGPDYDLHSWIGIALIPAISVHLVSNWRWVENAARRRRSHPEWHLARFNALFSALTAICIVTGFPLWFGWATGGFLAGLHTVTGFLSVAFALSHLWRNRQRVSRLISRQTTMAQA